MKTIYSLAIAFVIILVCSCSQQRCRSILAKRIVHINPHLGPKFSAQNYVPEKEDTRRMVVDDEKKEDTRRMAVDDENVLDLKNIPAYFSSNCQMVISKKSPVEYKKAAKNIKKWIERFGPSDSKIPMVYYESKKARKMDKNTLLIGTFCDKYITEFVIPGSDQEPETTPGMSEQLSSEDCGNPYSGYDVTMQLVKPHNSKNDDIKLLLFMCASPDKVLEASERLPDMNQLAGSSIVSF
jgi:hypothetical protein